MKKMIFLTIIFSYFLTNVSAKLEIDKAFITRERRTKDGQGVFTIYSPDIPINKMVKKEQLFTEFDCNGKNIRPKFIWNNPIKETKSFALTIFDKDADTGSGWWNWVIYNIPNDVNELGNVLPKNAVEVINDYGYVGYGGPCILDNKLKHNYVITLYALNIEKIDLDKDSTPAMVNLYLNKYKIKTATLSFYYEKPKISKENVKNKKEVEEIRIDINGKKVKKIR
jgi:Raf kinase inhibitor-like YbhB/YbcL family protein